MSINEPLVYLKFETGERTEFPVYKHPRVLNDGMSGIFSPSGEYVLINFRYDADDHYQGGHLQIFDVEGKFVAEVATSTVASIDQAYWLHNNWLVYGVHGRVFFEKFDLP